MCDNPHSTNLKQYILYTLKWHNCSYLATMYLDKFIMYVGKQSWIPKGLRDSYTESISIENHNHMLVINTVKPSESATHKYLITWVLGHFNTIICPWEV